MNSKIVFTEEGGTWSAHDPGVPGVYGVGSSREAALADMEEAMALLVDHEAGEVDEDAEDVRLADAAYEQMLADAPVYSHEEVRRMVGVDEVREPGHRRLVGILSDIHGDHVSLGAALARLRELGVDMVVCAGDVIDGEPFGEECIKFLREASVVTIKGNHERWRLDGFLAEAGTGEELSREALTWLATLPVHWEGELGGIRVAMWHARPGSDMEGIEKEKTGFELRRRLLEQAHAQILIVGHTHVEFELVVNTLPGKILNPGACCGKAYLYKQAGALIVPDEFRPSTFGVLELPSMRFKVFRALDGKRVFGTSPDRP